MSLIEHEAERALRRSNASSSWSDEDLRTLEDFIKKETPVPIIADRMGRSQEAIRARPQLEGWLTTRPRKKLSIKS